MMMGFACIACGDVSSGDDPTSDPNPTEFECRSCGEPRIVIAPPVDPPPAVHAFPQRLMFYGDAGAPDGLLPQVVTVKNATSSTILVIKAYIVDDSAGTHAFSVDYPDLEQPLLGNGE